MENSSISSHTMNHVVAELKAVLAEKRAKDPTELEDMALAKEQVVARYGQLFSVEDIRELSKQDFLSLLQLK